jgi:hypothetical protein
MGRSLVLVLAVVFAPVHIATTEDDPRLLVCIDTHFVEKAESRSIVAAADRELRNETAASQRT